MIAMKSNYLLKSTFFCGLIFSFLTINAEVKLPALFSDKMVLQQKSDVAIWGTAKKGSTLKLNTSWNNKQYVTSVAADGKWKIKIATPKAGGPYQINITDGEAFVLKDIMIGEVWVLSGQSNMQMPMKGFQNQPVLGSLDVIVNSTNSKIRLFFVKNVTSNTPLSDFDAKWNYSDPSSVSGFSAVGYMFGLKLHQMLNVPIGLISSSWGGTRIEPWMSEMGVKNFDWVKVPDASSVKEFTRGTPTAIFNGMINPLVGYGIRGVLWYQGEGNREQPKEYEKLMPGLIQDWRNLWQIGDFPFYYVQIAPYGYPGAKTSAAFIREAQLKASSVLPNTGMVSVLDIGDEAFIHPPNKETVAKRLAYMALENTYDFKGINANSPVYQSFTIEQDTIKLTFKDLGVGLTSYGKPLVNFEIAGSDKNFVPAKAIITKKGINVMSPDVKNPFAVRYAFKSFVVGDLFGVNGLPVSSFRTDDW